MPCIIPISISISHIPYPISHIHIPPHPHIYLTPQVSPRPASARTPQSPVSRLPFRGVEVPLTECTKKEGPFPPSSLLPPCQLSSTRVIMYSRQQQPTRVYKRPAPLPHCPLPPEPSRNLTRRNETRRKEAKQTLPPMATARVRHFRSSGFLVPRSSHAGAGRSHAVCLDVPSPTFKRSTFDVNIHHSTSKRDARLRIAMVHDA